MIALNKYITIISRCSMQYKNDRLLPLGLCGKHCSCIINVCKNPGVSQDKLAKMTYINKSNITRQLTQLEEDGFVERKTSESDKRVIEVYPTGKALDVLPKVYDVLHELNAYLTEDFTDEERELLKGFMERITAKSVEYVSGNDRSDEG